MSRKFFAVTLVFLCVAQLMLIQIPSTNGELTPTSSSEPAAARSLTLHDPIYINGNDQFTEANGVSAGNGTAENPYVVENWDINASSAGFGGSGIDIRNTDAHFIIKNCCIYDGAIPTDKRNGIYFYNVTNGKIRNITSENNGYGVFFELTKNSQLFDSVIANNTGCGIQMTGRVYALSLYNLISNCTVSHNSNGILLFGASDNIIQNTTVSDSSTGIYIYTSGNTWPSYNNTIVGCQLTNNSHSGITACDHVYNNTFENNNISINSGYGILGHALLGSKIVSNYLYMNGGAGVQLYNGASNNFIEKNIFTENGCGLRIFFSIGSFPSDNNTIYRNNFINDTQNAFDEHTNVWNTGSEGNYWSDYTGADTNGDGIGDDPYYIPGGSNKDNYPLMFTYPIKRNLKVTNLTLKSTTQGLKIAANVTNDGITDLTNVTIGIYVNETSVSEQKIDMLKNTTQTIFAYWWVPIGKYTIKVKADPENSVKEINELDNEVSTYIELSDVAVATEDITAAVVQNGIQLNVTLHNPGPALIGAPTYIYIDSKLEHQELVGVPAESINNLSFIWNGPSGDHDVLVVVDPENLFTEASETNNNATKTIYMLTGAPDLSIISTDIYFNPSTPVEGRNTTVTAIVHNVGYANASTATITFYDNENIIYTAALPAIEQGGQYPISTTFAAYNGHTIKVELTTTGIEYNLGNNYATAELNTVLPDLYIDSKNITITPSKPVEGGSTSITAKIYNMGEGTGEATVQFFADSNLIDEKQTGEIPPGLSAEVTIIWNNTTAGAIISIKILPTYPDAQSWNNEAETLLEETKTYTLIPKNITFSPDPPIQNQSTTVSVEIWNTGEANSPNAVITFWDGNTHICNESIGPVPPGEHLNVSATWAHAQKEHTVYVKIDISPYTASKLLLTTKMPDLTISNITFSEQYPENNKTILISITVKNQGNATSEQAELKVYAGDTLLQVITIAPLPAGASDTKEVSWQAQNLVRIKAEFTTSIDADTGNNFLDLLSPETTPPQQKTIPAEQVISLGGAIITALVGLSIYYKRYAIFSLLAPLQHRFLTKEKIISTPLRRQILAILEENPGSNTFSLVKMTNKHYNAIDYNLKLLKEFQLVKMIDTGYDKKYYLETQYTGLEPTPEIERKIIDVVFLNPRSSPTEVAKIIDPTADENFIQMVRRKLRDLEIRGIFTAQYDGDIPKYSFAYPRSAVK